MIASNKIQKRIGPFLRSASKVAIARLFSCLVESKCKMFRKKTPTKSHFCSNLYIHILAWPIHWKCCTMNITTRSLNVSSGMKRIMYLKKYCAHLKKCLKLIFRQHQKMLATHVSYLPNHVKVGIFVCVQKFFERSFAGKIILVIVFSFHACCKVPVCFF